MLKGVIKDKKAFFDKTFYKTKKRCLKRIKQTFGFYRRPFTF